MSNKLSLVFISIIIVACAPAPQQATVFYNANIITMENEAARADAMAVANGRIIAIGSKTEVFEQVSRNSQQIDLHGKTVLPGFIDAHGHFSYTLQTLLSANVSPPPVGPASAIADIQSTLTAFASKVPENNWLTGWGYDDSLLEEKRHPTAADLDKVSATQPILLQHVSGHFLSCNTACLKLAGITADTPDPPGGIIRRLPNGEPDGVLEETAMMLLLEKLPRPTLQQKLQLLDATQQYYASYGVTTLQEGAASPDDLELLRTADEQEKLYLDVIAYPYVLFFADKLNELTIDANIDAKRRFHTRGIKLVLDGSPQGKTAWLSEPYLQPPHGQNDDYTGYPTLKNQQVDDYIEFAFSNKIPVLAHANGDAAADQLIQAVSRANQKLGLADRRTVMIHAQTVREDQIDTMLEQDIMPSYFSAHTFYWGDWHRDSVFGIERAQRISPLKSSLDKGLDFTTHNDTPIVPPDMLRLLWASVNRQTRSGQTLGAEQAISPYQTLRSITTSAAKQYFMEDQLGQLKQGMRADFVVLDKNPLAVNPLTIKDIDVLATYKAGRQIYPTQSND